MLLTNKVLSIVCNAPANKLECKILEAQTHNCCTLLKIVIHNFKNCIYFQCYLTLIFVYILKCSL